MNAIKIWGCHRAHVKNVSLLNLTARISTFVGVFLAFYFSIISANAAESSKGSALLIIEVTNIKAVTGTLYVAIYDSPESYNNDKMYIKQRVPVLDETVSIKFKDIPCGEYGIKIFHDINSNGKLDRSFIGIPKEPFGFSKNPEIKRGPPDFSELKFAFCKDKNQTITINLVDR